MILVHFLIIFAEVTLVLAAYALIAYAIPQTLPGRVAAVLRG